MGILTNACCRRICGVGMWNGRRGSMRRWGGKGISLISLLTTCCSMRSPRRIRYGLWSSFICSLKEVILPLNCCQNVLRKTLKSNALQRLICYLVNTLCFNPAIAIQLIIIIWMPLKIIKPHQNITLPDKMCTLFLIVNLIGAYGLASNILIWESKASSYKVKGEKTGCLFPALRKCLLCILNILFPNCRCSVSNVIIHLALEKKILNFNWLTTNFWYSNPSHLYVS